MHGAVLVPVLWELADTRCNGITHVGRGSFRCRAWLRDLLTTAPHHGRGKTLWEHATGSRWEERDAAPSRMVGLTATSTEAENAAAADAGILTECPRPRPTVAELVEASAAAANDDDKSGGIDGDAAVETAPHGLLKAALRLCAADNRGGATGQADFQAWLDAQNAENGQTAVMAASLSGDAVAVDLLASAGADLALGENFGYTPLHGAAFSGRPEAAAALVRHLGRETVNHAAQSDGYTPLWRAVWGETPEHEETVRVLLEAGGADPNFPCGPGCTGPVPSMLRYAIGMGSRRNVQTLLRHGAIPTDAALEQARREGHVDIAADIEHALTFGGSGGDGDDDDVDNEGMDRRVAVDPATGEVAAVAGGDERDQTEDPDGDDEDDWLSVAERTADHDFGSDDDDDDDDDNFDWGDIPGDDWDVDEAEGQSTAAGAAGVALGINAQVDCFTRSTCASCAAESACMWCQNALACMPALGSTYFQMYGRGDQQTQLGDAFLCTPGWIEQQTWGHRIDAVLANMRIGDEDVVLPSGTEDVCAVIPPAFRRHKLAVDDGTDPRGDVVELNFFHVHPDMPPAAACTNAGDREACGSQLTRDVATPVGPVLASRLFGALPRVHHAAYHGGTSGRRRLEWDLQTPSVALQTVVSTLVDDDGLGARQGATHFALDLGSGTGRDTRWLAAQGGYTATGVDVSAAAIDKAREQGTNVVPEFLHYDALQLPRPAEHLSLVWDNTVYCNLRHEFLPAVRRMFLRLTSPGTVVVVNCASANEHAQSPQAPPRLRLRTMLGELVTEDYELVQSFESVLDMRTVGPEGAGGVLSWVVVFQRRASE